MLRNRVLKLYNFEFIYYCCYFDNNFFWVISFWPNVIYSDLRGFIIFHWKLDLGHHLDNERICFLHYFSFMLHEKNVLNFSVENLIARIGRLKINAPNLIYPAYTTDYWYTYTRVINDINNG